MWCACSCSKNKWQLDQALWWDGSQEWKRWVCFFPSCDQSPASVWNFYLLCLHLPTMPQKSYKPALFHCHFPGCCMKCKSPGGLTQHQGSCKFNPENQYCFSPQPESNGSVHGILPHTPPPQMPLRQQHEPEVPPTPSQSTPHRATWQTCGHSGIYVKKHPYLDGNVSFIFFRPGLNFNPST